MTRPFARGLTTLFLIVAMAGAAEADETIQGDGFSLSVPGGFTRLPASECGT